MTTNEVELRFKEFRTAYWEVYNEIPLLSGAINPDVRT
jgi:hypothetical protein